METSIFCFVPQGSSWRYFHPTLHPFQNKGNTTINQKQGTEKSLCPSFSTPFCQAWYPSVQFLSVPGNQLEAGGSDIQQPLQEGKAEAITKRNSKGIWYKIPAIKFLQRSTILGDLQINRMRCNSTGAHQAIRIVWPSLGTDGIMAILSWLPSGSLLPLPGPGLQFPKLSSSFWTSQLRILKVAVGRSISLVNNFRVIVIRKVVPRLST